MPRHLRSVTVNTSSSMACAGELPTGVHGPGVGVLELRPALFELNDGAADAVEDVERFESGDHDGQLELLDERFVLPGPHHAAHVSGGQEPVDPTGGGGGNGCDRRRYEHVGDQQRQVGQTALPGLVGNHGVAGRRRLEADGEEHDLLVGVVLGHRDSVQWGVDDPDVAATGADAEQVGVGSRHPEHVAERAEDDVVPGGDLKGPVDHLQWRDAHGTAGAVDQFDLVGQKLVDAVPDDGVGLPTADLHDRPRSGDHGRDVGEQLLGQGGVVELVEVLHAIIPETSAGASSPISARGSARSGRRWRSPRVCRAPLPATRSPRTARGSAGRTPHPAS